MFKMVLSSVCDESSLRTFYYFNPNYKGVVFMNKTPDVVINTAKAEVGYLEKKNGDTKYLYDKTANAGTANYTKFAYEMDNKFPNFMNGKKQGVAWCAIFVTHSFIKSYGESEAHKMLYQPTKSAGAGCPYAANYYRNNNAFYSSPKPGDQIFFGKKGAETHTGIVYKVDSTKVYTIEGNTSNASGVVANGGGVAMKSYPLSYSSIVGYGRPKYDSVATPTKTTTTTVKAETKPENLEKITTYVNKTGALLPVYADTTCKTQIGTLSAGSDCKCLGIYNGFAVLLYRIVKDDYYKVGFTKRTEGVIK